MFSAIGIPLALTLAVAPAIDSSRSVMIAAARAVEGDSAARVAARWMAHLRRAPRDRMASLGLGYLAQLQYRYTEADRRGRAVAASGRDGIAVRGLLLSAAARSTQARLRSADTVLSDALRLAEGLDDAALVSEALVALATTRLRLAGPRTADSLLTRAGALVPPGDVRLQAAVRCARALVLATRARPEARTEALAASALAGQAGEWRLQASCLTVVAQDWIRIGRSDSAAATFGEVLALQGRARDRAGMAITRQWRGYLAATVGAYAEALRDLREAVREGTAVGTPTPVAWASLSLADIALRFGEFDEAADHAARARQSFQRAGDALGASTALGVMGDMARARGEVRQARTWYEEALVSATRDGRVVNAHTLQRGIADLSMMEGAWDRALRELDGAREIARRGGMREWERGLLDQELLLALRRNKLDEADEIRRRRDWGEAQRGRAYTSRVLVAELHARRGDLDSAQAYLTLAFDEVDRWRAGLDERQFREAVFEPKQLFADPDLGVATIISTLAQRGRAAAAFELVERQRARTLLERIARDRAAGERTSEVPPSTPTITSREGIRNRGRYYYERSLTVDQLRAALPDERTALLEFVTGAGNEPTTLFAMTREGMRWYRLPPIDSVSPVVDRALRYAEGGVSAPAVWRALGTMLLGDALVQLPAEVSRLVVVPHEGLHRVPWDALAVDRVPALVDRYEIALAPSAAVARALWLRGGRSSAGRLLAFGDPRFAALPGGSPLINALQRAGLARNGQLPRLPFSGAEVRSIARLVDRAEVRTGAAASEAWLKSSPLGDYGILHLATHAWVDDRTPRATAVVLSAGDGEDGVVIPADLAALELDADLVMLSACATAGGIVRRGEGVLGLVAPLVEAGARSVVASHWRVSDRAAARFATDFYAKLGEGAAVGEALTAAKRLARRRGAPVNEWAAFHVLGNATVRPTGAVSP